MSDVEMVRVTFADGTVITVSRGSEIDAIETWRPHPNIEAQWVYLLQRPTKPMHVGDFYKLADEP